MDDSKCYKRVESCFLVPSFLNIHDTQVASTTFESHKVLVSDGISLGGVGGGQKLRTHRVVLPVADYIFKWVRFPFPSIYLLFPGWLVGFLILDLQETTNQFGTAQPCGYAVSALPQ